MPRAPWMTARGPQPWPRGLVLIRFNPWPLRGVSQSAPQGVSWEVLAAQQEHGGHLGLRGGASRRVLGRRGLPPRPSRSAAVSLRPEAPPGPRVLPTSTSSLGSSHVDLWRTREPHRLPATLLLTLSRSRGSLSAREHGAAPGAEWTAGRWHGVHPLRRPGHHPYGPSESHPMQRVGPRQHPQDRPSHPDQPSPQALRQPGWSQELHGVPSWVAGT